MTGGGGGLGGGEGGNHRPLTGMAGGCRYTNYAGFGYVRGHPGDSISPNPPTYQMTRQFGHDFQHLNTMVYRSTRSLHESQGFKKSGSLPALQNTRGTSGKGGTLFADLHAHRLFAQQS